MGVWLVCSICLFRFSHIFIRTRLFVRLAITTLLTLFILFAPFLPPFSPLSAVLHPIQRIFPFGRGLFEDKVSNFWCASNVVFKWKNVFSRSLLVKFSTLFTAVGFAPGVVVLLQNGYTNRLTASDTNTVQKPTPMLPLLVYVMLTASSSFFLFSFQVHEKSILLPLLPMTLLMSASGPESSSFRWGVLMNNSAVFSMWPLLKRDGLGIQYFVLLLLWNRLIGYNPFKLPKLNLVQLASFTFYISIMVLHLLEILVTPPARYPDLFVVLNVLVTTPVFVLCWLWSIRCTTKVAWALQGPGAAAPLSGVGKSARGQESLGRSTGEPVASTTARRTPIPSTFRQSPRIEPGKGEESTPEK
jgi:alpha-1,3-glucosyltransferase